MYLCLPNFLAGHLLMNLRRFSTCSLLEFYGIGLPNSKPLNVSLLSLVDATAAHWCSKSPWSHGRRPYLCWAQGFFVPSDPLDMLSSSTYSCLRSVQVMGRMQNEDRFIQHFGHETSYSQPNRGSQISLKVMYITTLKTKQHHRISCCSFDAAPLLDWALVSCAGQPVVPLCLAPFASKTHYEKCRPRAKHFKWSICPTGGIENAQIICQAT